jgi:arylsulfatase A-like enzyme
VPFLIRWPGKIPPQRVSNEIVHAVDLFPTLANWVGGKIRKDRTMDGADQSGFLMGKSEKSARESVMIYVGNEIFGLKWRNWKLLFKDMAEHSPHVARTLTYPSVYNLLIDPKEEVPELNYLADTWVDARLYQVLEDFQASLEKDRGTPGP